MCLLSVIIPTAVRIGPVTSRSIKHLLDSTTTRFEIQLYNQLYILYSLKLPDLWRLRLAANLTSSCIMWLDQACALIC